MNILLTGKNGQVGFELQHTLGPLGEIIAVDIDECNLCDTAALRGLIRAVNPNIIVNPAAYTAVDQAESERGIAHAINGIAPGIIGDEARKLNSLVIHYSTDYVFDGRKSSAYTETDQTNPLSVYGKSKLEGENALRDSGAHFITLRTSWVFGTHGQNFVKTILRLATEKEELKVISDQIGAPTSAKLIAEVTRQIIQEYISNKNVTNLNGLYHMTAGGVTSWYEYAQYIVNAALTAGKTLKLKPEKITAIPTSDYPVPATRPANSRLNTQKIEHEIGIQLPAWQQGLDQVLTEIL